MSDGDGECLKGTYAGPSPLSFPPSLPPLPTCSLNNRHQNRGRLDHRFRHVQSYRGKMPHLIHQALDGEV